MEELAKYHKAKSLHKLIDNMKYNELELMASKVNPRTYIQALNDIKGTLQAYYLDRQAQDKEKAKKKQLQEEAKPKFERI